jgi:sugar phosphate isomerase/epimerase
MKTISRRQFIAATAAGFAAATLRLKAAEEAASDLLDVPPGCQIWGVREQLVADFDGTLKQLHDAGYRLIEFCSPPGYNWEGGGLGPLMALSAEDIRRRAEAAGVRMVSCHYGYQELLEHIDERIEFAQVLGLEQMVIASAGNPETMDAWMEVADNLNKLGEKVKKARMQFGYHNHRQEWQIIDGVLVFDALTKRFDPELVKWQFHLENPASGHDPLDILSKYEGRIFSLHIMDYAENQRGAVPVGQGVIDWKKLFAAAKASGVKYYFVEMDMEALKASSPYLLNLKGA